MVARCLKQRWVDDLSVILAVIVPKTFDTFCSFLKAEVDKLELGQKRAAAIALQSDVRSEIEEVKNWAAPDMRNKSLCLESKWNQLLGAVSEYEKAYTKAGDCKTEVAKSEKAAKACELNPWVFEQKGQEVPVFLEANKKCQANCLKQTGSACGR